MGSEMCIRDSPGEGLRTPAVPSRYDASADSADAHLRANEAIEDDPGATLAEDDDP